MASRSMLRGSSVLLVAVVLFTLAFLGLHVSTGFLAPVPNSQSHHLQPQLTASLFAGVPPQESAPGRDGRTAMAVTGVGAKVLQAMSAGLVASVVSAMLAAVTEPIMNRVLVKRMSIKDAMGEMSPALVLSFFTTTISTNLLKFPLFEAVSMFLSLLPEISNLVRGLVVGFIFTTATLPITNFRYRMSIQTPVAEALKPALLYQAYPATVIRDMVYAIGRNVLTAFLLARTGLVPGSASLMFPVVIGACVLSAPFNEVRGYLLQSGSQKLTFKEFFKPANFIRSTTLGALNMGVSVATGYYLTPIVASKVSIVHAALDSGNPLALIGIILAFDALGFIVAQGMTKNVFSRRIDANKDQVAKNKDNIAKNKDDISDLLQRMEAMEAANKRLSQKVVDLGGKPEES
eukprot:TRINITY_DN79349_c0_g1_i1.p1 TRINITY_DN79349_c0_g1~~TRINITY_DN79349_c0_g1_i1.p1  ORF type:complete len:421 (+),score=98.90 TRINITY_DN79349_c0_g1_i1:53-1264(+)